MPLTVDRASDLPPFEQVRAGVEELIATGELGPGDRLPTVRALAEQLGLAPNTVARAYRELEAAGVVETRGRHGTRVAATGTAAQQAAIAAARTYAERVAELGLDPDEALALVTRMLAPGSAGPPRSPRPPR